MKRLVVPAALVVSSLAVGGCNNPPPGPPECVANYADAAIVACEPRNVPAGMFCIRTRCTDDAGVESPCCQLVA